MSIKEHPFTNIEPLSGTGMYCELYKALRYNQWWVLKTLKMEYVPQQSMRNALYKEYEIGKQLNSQFIVRYLSWEYVPELQRYCIVQEFIQGVTLKDYLVSHHLNSRMRYKFCMEMIEALKYCAARQVVHRDLKPSNVMVTNNGQNIKLVDFGLSDRDDFAILKAPAGSLLYMAPEQKQKGARVNFRADMYALGKIMLDIKVSKRFHSVILRCTDPQPSQRYSSFEELEKDFKAKIYRYRVQMRTIVTAVVFSVLSVTAFVLGYGPLGGSILGYEGKKEAYKSVPTEYYLDNGNYADSSVYSSFFMPEHNCNIYYLTPSAPIPGPIDESRAVDLGLSVKWAPFNLGCKRESLIMLGALVGYGDVSGHCVSSNITDYHHGDITPETDIVRRYWGGNWRTPTYEELRELVNRCQWRVVIENGHQPCFVVTGPNGNSIVMAGTGARYLRRHYEALTTGYYWSSTYGSDKHGEQAICLAITRDNFKFIESLLYYGHAIRPVLPYAHSGRKQVSRHLRDEYLPILPQ